MKREQVIKTRSRGLKWYDHVLTEYTVEQIIQRTIEIAKEFPTVYQNDEWSKMNWAFGNAFIELYDKMKIKIRNNGQSSFNLDEVLTDEQIKYLADECKVTQPYKSTYSRE